MAKKQIGSVAPLIHTNKAQLTPDDAKTKRAIKMPVQIFRITTDLSKYRTAVLAAENIWNPNRYMLYQLYNQTELDAHVTACIMQRMNLILGSEFCVYKNNVESDDKTKIIRTKWFRELITYALQSIYWGHSLVQFEDIINLNSIDQFREVELVPRHFVKPEFHMVMASTASLPPDGINYTELPYSNWCLPVGKSRDLGLFLKITPLVIWKKNAMGAWAEFIEKFGSPIRIGKTDSTDLESVNNMQDMLRNMGVASWGLFKTDDIIELVESNHADAFQVFNQMIERCNQEISKLILGQTMTTDNGSSRSQAEVHERILDAVGDSDATFIENMLNDQLIPLMNTLGFGLEGCEIRIKEDDELSLKDKGLFDIELLKTGKFTMTPKYILEKYGTEVVPVVESNPAALKNYQNLLSKYYQ